MKKVLLFFLFILLLIGIHTLTKDKYIYIGDKINYDYNDTAEFIELRELAKNITFEMMDFFNYNISNIDVPYDEDYLIKYGGVCWHYSEFAYRIGIENIEQEIFSQKVIIYTNKTRRHQFTIISNKGGYCVIDQTRYSCFPLLI